MKKNFFFRGLFRLKNSIVEQQSNRTAIANEKYRVFCYRVFCSSGMFQWNKKSEQALIILIIKNDSIYYIDERATAL